MFRIYELIMAIDCDLMRLYYLNHSTHEPWHSVFILLYTIVILTAFMFNSLVLYAVYRRSQRPDHEASNNVRTRNTLIGHLCTLDVLLTFTMPWTAIDALTKFWPFGFETQIICKVTKSASAAVVYSSSMMIIVIAIDSYRQIVHASETQLTPPAIFQITPFILSLAVLMSFPIFYHTRLISPNEVNDYETSENSTSTSSTTPSTILLTDPATSPDHQEDYELASPKASISYNMTYDNYVTKLQPNQESCGMIYNDGNEDWTHVVYCVEDWDFGGQGQDPVNRIYYSIFSLTVQYSIPFFTISILYFLVYLKLKKMSAVRNSMLNQSAEETRRSNHQRERRTNRMLITISMVFCFCWLPLNLIGALMDADPYLFGSATDTMNIIFMTCHIIGMCSACINPVIYGFCNETIRTGIINAM